MSSMIDTLRHLEADYSVFYRKLRAFHWNVNGPQFFTLHAKFEELYNAFALKVDELAERTLQLGGQPMPTYAAVLGAARLKECPEMPDASGMVSELFEDLKSLNRSTREAMDAAEEANDKGTASLLDDFALQGEKEAWMLGSFLGKAENVTS